MGNRKEGVRLPIKQQRVYKKKRPSAEKKEPITAAAHQFVAKTKASATPRDSEVGDRGPATSRRATGNNREWGLPVHGSQKQGGGRVPHLYVLGTVVSDTISTEYVTATPAGPAKE